jgi:hypothetical protein
MLAHTKLNRVKPLEPKNKLAHLLSSIFETQKTRTPLGSGVPVFRFVLN